MASKFETFLKIIKQNGGIINSIKTLRRFDDLKDGCLVGCDKYGNKYFENSRYFFGRNRWVHYAPHFALNYDASQIPPEWYGWMHYRTDLIPECDKSRPKHKWMLDHSENLTGTTDAYMPCSTTRPKIEAWVPTSNSKKKKC